MIRTFTTLVALLAIIAGIALFQLKFAVQEQGDHVSALERQIVEDREALRVLKAEWSYLSSPAQLQPRAIRHLGLTPTTPDRILDHLGEIPFRAIGATAVEGLRRPADLTGDTAAAVPDIPRPRTKPRPQIRLRKTYDASWQLEDAVRRAREREGT